MKYAIYGAGSLGTVLGAMLAKKGIDIALVNRNAAHVDALNQNGAIIQGTIRETVPVHAILPSQMEGPYDIILLLTKQLSNRETCAFLKPLLRQDGVIVTFQNGIPEDGIAEVIGRERTIGCVVEWGATLDAPGRVTLTSEPDSLSFHMGGMPGVPKERIQQVKALLENMCTVEEEENLAGVRWSKLLINATFSGIGTVIGGNFGQVAGSSATRKVAIRCMKECIDTGRAAGVTFAPVQGKDTTRLFYYTNPVKRLIGQMILPIAIKKHAAIVPSMLQDVQKHKPCEVDAINGVVCDRGKKLNVPTPINDRIVSIIHRIEKGELQPEAKNIRLFDDLL